MDRCDEAKLLLKQSKAIASKASGCKLELTRPALGEWTSNNDDWLWNIALYYAAAYHNNAEGPDAVVADIQRISQKVREVYGIED